MVPTSKELIVDNVKLILRENVYPKLFYLYKMSLILPVTSFKCERSFSAKRRIKTWLWTSTLPDRFSHVYIYSRQKILIKRSLLKKNFRWTKIYNFKLININTIINNEIKLFIIF